MISETRTSALLVVDKVGKAFRRGTDVVTALQNVSIEVRQGEFISVIGPSGCGKSTLFNLLTKAEVTARDALFATLDPTDRKSVV